MFELILVLVSPGQIVERIGISLNLYRNICKLHTTGQSLLVVDRLTETLSSYRLSIVVFRIAKRDELLTCKH